MLDKQKFAHKRGYTLLIIFFASFFSIIVNAQTPGITDFNAQIISVQLSVINQQISNKNNSYEELTHVLHEIKSLQHQISTCIHTGQARLDKINHLLNETGVSNTIMQDKPSYNYLLKEKANKLSQVETCSFLNYRLEEIQDMADDRIDRVSKIKMLKKIPIWEKLNFNLFSNINLHAESIYQRSGIGQLNKMYWFGVALTGLFGLIFAFFLRKTSGSQTTLANNLSKDYIPYILPLGLICIYLNVMFPFTLLTTLMINAVTFYMLTLFLVKLYFTIGMQPAPSLSNMYFFPVFVAPFTFFFVITFQAYLASDEPISLKYVNFIYITYIVLIIKLIVICKTGLKKWLTEKMVVTIRTRVFVLATISLLAYTIYITAGALSFPSDFFALLNTLYITLLNMAYFWLIAPFLNHWVPTPYRKSAIFSLKILCLAIIIAAWCGYHYLAIAFIPNLIITAGAITLILDVNTFFKRAYCMLSDPSNLWSQKLRYLLGLNADDKLMELYVLRLAYTLSAILWVLAIMEIWGVTSYQILNLLIKGHNGISVFGIIIKPGYILRGCTFFCIVILSGRALATWIVRKNLLHEEKHTQIMLFSLLQYISFAVGMLIALYMAGINLKNLVVAGALSVGLGFGLQSFARDFISGLIIMINKPIKIGDHIEVGDRNKNEGFIKRIGAFSTQLHTLSHSDVIIPNSEIITKIFTNFTFSNNSLSRVNITVSLDKNSNFDLAKQLLLDIATKNPNVIQEPPYQPVVLFELYDLNLWCIINDVNKKDIIVSELNLEIAHALKDLLPQPD